VAEASSPDCESARPIRVDCKPGSVPIRRCRRSGEDHSSRRRVATALKHSNPGTPCTPKSARSDGPSSKVPLFKLAPGRACLAAGHPAVARGLLPHDFNLTGRARCARRGASPLAGWGTALRRCDFCCAFPRVAPGRCYRLPCPVEPGLSSRGRFVSAGDLPSTSDRQQSKLADLTDGAQTPRCKKGFIAIPAFWGQRETTVAEYGVDTEISIN